MSLEYVSLREADSEDPARPLRVALELVRQARRVDERKILTLTAEAIRGLTGAARARVLLPGDDMDPSVRVAVAGAPAGAENRPIQLPAPEEGSPISFAFPIVGSTGPFGTVLVFDVPWVAASPSALDAGAAVVELVSAALDAARVRTELER